MRSRAQSFSLGANVALGSVDVNSYFLSRNILPGPDAGVFVVGVFPDTVVLGVDTLTTALTDAVYLTRLDSDLTVMWSRVIAENQMGGGASHMTIASTTNQVGNIILGITYADELYFYGDTVGQVGSVGIHLLKLDINGDTIWTKHADGEQLGKRGVSANEQGEILLTGYAATDVFVAKYSSAGDLVWNRTAGGSGFDQGAAVVVDVLSNVFVMGGLGPQGPIHFDTLQPTIPGGAVNVMFVAKYDANGTIQWVRYVYSLLWAHPTGFAAMECDANGNVILAGRYEDTILRFSNGLTSVGPQMGGYPLAFLTAFDTNGNRLWVNTSPPSDTGHDEALDLELFGSAALVLNSFYGQVPSVNGSMDNYGFDDMRLQTFDLSGSLLADMQIGGTSSDFGNQLLTSAERVFLLGYTFSHPVHVGADEFDHADQGNTFVIELAEDPNAVPQHVAEGTMRVFPSPSSGLVTLALSSTPTNGQLIVRDPLGREVLRQQVRDRYSTLLLPTPGMYLVELWEQGVRSAIQRVVVE